MPTVLNLEMQNLVLVSLSRYTRHGLLEIGKTDGALNLEAVHLPPKRLLDIHIWRVASLWPI